MPRLRIASLVAVFALVAAACGGVATATPAPAPTAAPSAAPSPAPTATAPAPTPAPTPTPQPGLTGPIGDGRQVHTATRLADGRVLVAGGFDINNLPLASTALYDPTTGAFSATGSLAAPRGQHTATLLSDGRVLVAGGGPPSWTGAPAFLASAELFDPKTGVFIPAGSMTTPRMAHTATRLNDGRVLITGGDDTWDGHALASAELYDPTTGSFSPTGSMATARSFHTATLLTDGRVLIVGGTAGGWSFTGTIYASAEIYDPRKGTFSPTGSMSVGRAWQTATLLADGRVLVAGGEHEGIDLASAEIYNPQTGKFTPTGSMAAGRIYHTASLLADGRVLVAGGGSDYTNGAFLASAELYDPKTGTFSKTGSMAEARTYHAAVSLSDGRVLVTGGYGAKAPLASAELYDPKTGTFSPVQ